MPGCIPESSEQPGHDCVTVRDPNALTLRTGGQLTDQASQLGGERRTEARYQIEPPDARSPTQQHLGCGASAANSDHRELDLPHPELGAVGDLNCLERDAGNLGETRPKRRPVFRKEVGGYP